MTRAFEWLYRAFFEPVEMRALFLVRIGLGAIAAFHYARLAPHVGALFGPAGVGGHDTLARWKGFPGLGDGVLEPFRVLHLVESQGMVTALFTLLLASSVAFMLGLATRLSGLAMIALHVVFAAHQPYVTWGWAKMFPIYALYVTLAPSGQALGVDAWLRSRRGSPVPERPCTIVPWPVRLLQVHVVTMYMSAGLPRLVQQGWLEGLQVLYAVTDTRFARWGVDWYAVRPLLAIGNYYAFALEPLATVLLVIPKTRRWCVLLLVALHMGIEVVADVGMWQFLMSTVLLVFLPEEWLRRLPWLGGRPAAPAAATRQC